MKINVEIEVADGNTCGEYVSNYSHDGIFVGCKYCEYGECLIFNERLQTGEYEKSKKWCGMSKKVIKLEKCLKNNPIK